MWCEIKCEGKPIIVGVVYRCPSSSSENNNLLLDLLAICDSYSDKAQILVCGEFNYGAIDWENNCVEDGQHIADARKFLNMYNDLFFHQHVDEWTHNRGMENPSRLDLIFTKNELDIENLQYIKPIGKSHHSVLSFELVIEGNVVEVVDDSYRYSHQNGDYVKADGFFSETDWNALLSDKESSQMYTDFSSRCKLVIDECVPKYKNSNGIRRPRWMKKEVRNQLSAKERAWKRLRARKTGARKDKYKEERNKATY